MDDPIQAKIVQTQQANRVQTTRHDAMLLAGVTGLAAFGVLAWLVFASIAYIFNSRSPVAVLKGLFSRN